jgi:hypothetical protein
MKDTFSASTHGKNTTLPQHMSHLADVKVPAGFFWRFPQQVFSVNNGTRADLCGLFAGGLLNARYGSARDKGSWEGEEQKRQRGHTDLRKAWFLNGSYVLRIHGHGTNLRQGLKMGVRQALQQEKRRHLNREDFGIRFVGKFPHVRMPLQQLGADLIRAFLLLDF